MKTELQERTDILVSNLHRSVDTCFEIIRSISQLFASSTHVSRLDFQRFVGPALVRHPSIYALEWLPRLWRSDRPAFEQQVHQEGFPEFHITEKTSTGDMIRATERDLYFPVYYAEPLASNQLALGYDIASDPIRWAALERARDTGAIALSGCIELVQEVRQYAFLVVLPIYPGGVVPTTAKERQEALQGFVLGVFRLADVVNAALSGLNLQYTDFYLSETSPNGDEQLLTVYLAEQSQLLADSQQLHSYAAKLAHLSFKPNVCRRSFVVGDRQWALLLAPTAEYVDRIELYKQSELRADTAAAEAEKLKLVLRNLQQTQARWLLEKKLIAVGVGLVLLILGGANLWMYGAIATLQQSTVEREERSPTPDHLNDVTQSSLWLTISSIGASIVLLVGVYYLLQRQTAERQQVESALFEANNQLAIEVQQRLAELEKTREISDLKMRLFSMVSHEFRTPLSTILISTQLLASSPTQVADEKKTKNLARIQTAAKTMAQLLSDILTLNRAEAGKLDYRPELFDLIPFCRRLIDEVQASLDHPTVIEWICSREPSLNAPCTAVPAYADSKLLHSILSNLLSNAIKYSPPQQPVTLRLSHAPDAITFQVQDCGIGINPDDQPHLYETFYRGSNVGTIVGTGLGLSVVKTCVELHGGHISFDSTVGLGTTFTVVLPQ